MLATKTKNGLIFRINSLIGALLLLGLIRGHGLDTAVINVMFLFMDILKRDFISLGLIMILIGITIG